MAARRKRTASDGSGESRGYAVVVEELRSHFKVFGERLDGVEQRLDTRIDGVGQRLDGLEQRLDARIDGLEQRLDARIDGLEQRVTAQLADLSHEVGLVKIAVLEHGRALKEKVDRDEVQAMVERATGRRS
jgi:hypothetical protein